MPRPKGRKDSAEASPAADPLPGERTGVATRLEGWLVPAACALATLLLFRAFVFSDQMLFGSDTLSLGYVARDFYANAVRDLGVFPRWNPLILGGTPFIESLAGGDALYPTSLLLFLLEPYRALGWKLVIHVFLGGVFMAGWVRLLGRSRGAALVSGLAYSVAPFLVSLVHPGHDGKMFVIALTPLLFSAMEWTFVRRGLLPYVGVALVVTLVILTTHFQLAYFLFGAAGLYYLFRVVVWARRSREGEGSGRVTSDPADASVSAAGSGRRTPARAAGRFGLFLAAAVVGATAAGFQLAPAYGYVTEFSRRTATTTAAGPQENLLYASSWSLHPEEALAFVVPEFAGNNAGGATWAQDSYWGRNPFKDNHEYAGLVVLLLAVVGLVGRGRAVRWYLAGVGLLALLYALGTHTPVWRLAYELLPGVSLFRAPSMVSFLFGFATISLAAFGVDRLLALAGVRGVDPALEADGRRAGGGSAGGGSDAEGVAGPAGEAGPGAERTVAVLLGLSGALVVGLLLAGSGALFSLWTSMVWPDIDPARAQYLAQVHAPQVVRGFFLATLLAVATAAVAWAARTRRLPAAGVVAALAALVFFDGYRISAPFVEVLDFQQWAAPDAITEALVERQRADPPFRVASQAQGFQSVRPALFGLELATGHHPNDLARWRELIGMAGSGTPTLLFEPNVQQVVNLRYLVVQGELQGGPPPVLQTQVGGRVYESLYELPTLPRARLVDQAVVVGEDATLETLLAPGFDPAESVVLTEAPGVELAALPGAPGTVEWVERGPNRLVLRASAERAGLLVLADNWFPSWRASVGGVEAPVLRANHALRAVPVPAGEHEIVVHYDSPLLSASLATSIGALLLLVGVGLFSLWREPRGRSGS